MGLNPLFLSARERSLIVSLLLLLVVGALTSKPYAFQARPWELKKTESVDVLDGVGSNIRVDSRGVQVMRIQPRINDEVNEVRIPSHILCMRSKSVLTFSSASSAQEWINDKTRYSNDGLRFQRLTTPLVKDGDRFVPASWSDALGAVAEGLIKSGARGDEIKAVAGHLADTESLVALRDFVHRLGSENLALDHPLGSSPPLHGVDVRSNYLFNSTIVGLDSADAVLLVGTNPRHEGAIINTRLRRSYLNTPVQFGLIGEKVDLTYTYEHVGTGAEDVVKFLEGPTGKGFAKAFAEAKRPMIIVGSGITENDGGKAVYEALAKYVEKNKERFVTPEWNGLSILQRVSTFDSVALLSGSHADTDRPPSPIQAASRSAAYDIGFSPTAAASKTTPKFIYLLGADEVDGNDIPEDAFVVYQGHHGDVGAQFADVCLPGSAYTEKATTWVNTEGRSQLGRAAVPPPGASREDWKIIRSVPMCPYIRPCVLRSDICSFLGRTSQGSVGGA